MKWLLYYNSQDPKLIFIMWYYNKDDAHITLCNIQTTMEYHIEF